MGWQQLQVGLVLKHSNIRAVVISAYGPGHGVANMRTAKTSFQYVPTLIAPLTSRRLIHRSSTS